MVALPLGKLLYLGVKQLAKPIAFRIKSRAVKSPIFCKYICIPPAQLLHRLEHFVKLRITGGTGHTHIQPLKEAKAIEVGAEIIGEAFIYSIAASFIVFEYWRSSAKEAALEADQDNEIDTLKIQMKNVEEIVSRIDDRLASIEKIKNITAKK